MGDKKILKHNHDKKGSLESIASAVKVPTRQERLDLHRLLGFPSPPAQVFAVGRESCAAVWWSETGDSSVSSWEVHRFRKDKSKPNADIWHFKGFTLFTGLLKNQVIVDQLTNDYEYRFCIKSVNDKGVGVESDFSNGVMVETPLPTGW
jgi:hypothetical protein